MNQLSPSGIKQDLKKKPFKLSSSTWAVLSFVFLLLVWEMIARFSGWSEDVFPGPVRVFLSLWELSSTGILIHHTIASLFRVTIGFYLAMILGIPLGILMGRLNIARQILNPLIQFVRPISPLAWIPISMLWFGIGDRPAVFIIFLSSFFPLAVSATIAVSSINPVYFQVASNFNLNRVETITKIVIPAVIPAMITALRITITIAWLVVVAAEMIAVNSGLGYFILDSRNALRMDYVMDGMIVIGAIGLCLDTLMQRMGKIESIRWGSIGR